MGNILVTPDENSSIGQCVFLGLMYGYVLMKGSTMISDGSELLLLVDSLKDIVGSVILPILGAVPDGAIVLFSGLGDPAKAQEQVSVGVGALAGSTIMLLTIPWFLSIVGGRVDLVDGHAKYRRPRNEPPGAFQKLTKSISPWGVGVEAGPSLACNGYVMLGTGLTYVLIQAPATGLGCDYVDGKCDAAGEKWWAFASMILAFLSFVGYLVFQIKSGSNDDKSNAVIESKLLAGEASIVAVFRKHLQSVRSEQQEHGALLHQTSKAAFDSVCLKFFRQCDTNGDGSIDAMEFRFLVYDILHLKLDESQFSALLTSIDKDQNNSLDFAEFREAMFQMIIREDYSVLSDVITREEGEILEPGRVNRTSKAGYQTFEADDDNDGSDCEEEEEPEMPEDIAALPEDQQTRRVLYKACYLMGLGTFLVLVFSDPMVEVFSQLGTKLGIPVFYVSFVLAPVASNLSEVIASYSYAKKKTMKTITISFQALHGAACMNNTFCLGIFMALIFFKGLAWEFTAETLAILFVEIALAVASMKRVHNIFTGVMILMLYPASLALVYFLESIGLN